MTGLKARLVLGAAVMRHAQIRPIQMVDRAHGWDVARHDEIFDEGRAHPGPVVVRLERAGAGPPLGPLKGAFPLPGESLQAIEHAIALRLGGGKGKDGIETRGECDRAEDSSPAVAWECGGLDFFGSTRCTFA